MKKILIINNDPEMCCSLALILRDRYDVVSLTDTEDVKILLQHIKVDLILADVDTPKGDIIKILFGVKKHFPDINIVMFYIYFGNREMEEKVFEISDACIHKPFDNEDIIEVIEERLKGVSRISRH
jgi:DNA-binding NtrC family response regulator